MWNYKGKKTVIGPSDSLGPVTNYSSTNILYFPSSTGVIALTSSSSSRRTKKNIHNMPEERARKILDVNIVNFDYKDEWCNGEKDQSGVIAEDVINIIPEVVEVSKNYDPNLPVDGEFNNPPGVDYRKFIPYLIKMVQIQQKEIDELKKEANKK